MEVNFSPELRAKLDLVAAKSGGPTDEYVQRLVETYVDHDSWFRQKVAASLGRLDEGDFLSHEEVRSLLDKLVQG